MKPKIQKIRTAEIQRNRMPLVGMKTRLASQSPRADQSIMIRSGRRPTPSFAERGGSNPEIDDTIDIDINEKRLPG